MSVTYRLIGGNGSPYSGKMRALMRYRRIPFIWVMRTPEIRRELVDLKPQLVPVLQLPDSGEYMLDSTFQALALEERHPGIRSTIPDDPAQAFLSHLIEDMADEWVTHETYARMLPGSPQRHRSRSFGSIRAQVS